MGVEAVRVTSADWASMVLIVIVDFCVVVVCGDWWCMGVLVG